MMTNEAVSQPVCGGVSIIVPAYNAARYLPQTIESVLQQTISDWELILVDDGSEDETLVIAQLYTAQDARIRVLHQENAGVSAARNNGLAASTPAFPWVVFLDADDRYKPDALQTLRALLETDPQAIGAHAVAEIINAEGQPLQPGRLMTAGSQRSKYVGRRVQFSRPEEPTTFAHIITNCCIHTPGVVMLRRSKLSMNPLFNPAWSGPADWDLYIRLLRHGYFVFADQIVLEYRKYQGSMSSNRPQTRHAVQDMWRIALRSPENTLEQQEITRYCYRASCLFEARLRLGYALGALREGQFLNALRQLRYGSRYILYCLRG